MVTVLELENSQHEFGSKLVVIMGKKSRTASRFFR